jgi:hypothetical protein
MRFLLLVVVSLSAFRVSAETSVVDPAIKLPPYPVRGDMVPRPRESWRHAQIGEFEVLSSLGEKQTTEFATGLWKFQDLFRESFPLVKNFQQLPITLVICGSHGKFDELVPEARTATTARGSYFAADSDESVIVVDLQPNDTLPSAGMTSAEVMAANSGGQDMDNIESATANVALNGDQLLRREYIHFTLSRFNPRPPVWFAEGIAQLYCRLEADKDTYQFGDLNGILVQFFEQRQLMPMAKFFAVTYDSPEFITPVNGTFPAQALAFIHLCLYQNQGKLQKPLFELVRRAG